MYLSLINGVNAMSLQTMNKKWEDLNITHYFADVHHFSSGEFSSAPTSLTTFVHSCEGKNIRGENIQTIERALRVAKYVENGVEPTYAIKAVWADFPLCKEYN